MRFLTFSAPNESTMRVGALTDKDRVISLADGGLPGDMLAFIQAGAEAWEQASEYIEQAEGDWALEDVHVQAPLRPPSLRDFYAFEEHVATAHTNRGKEVPKEWYEIPVFYFSNPNPIFGPGEDMPMPRATQALDYELEVAAIIGKAGRDIPAEKAIDHIFGFTILNDWSARDLQRQEMKVGLGPAKGKDFASSLGPIIVSPDDLAPLSTDRVGVYDLAMTARINGKEFSRGNWNTLHYSFGEMIARASQGVELYPGDVIGSGTVGTGCLLELTKGQGPWLQKDDLVELEIEGIGVLTNRVR
jgi:fumarylacetoacetate (FAA) hydrolase